MIRRQTLLLQRRCWSAPWSKLVACWSKLDVLRANTLHPRSVQVCIAVGAEWLSTKSGGFARKHSRFRGWVASPASQICQLSGRTLALPDRVERAREKYIWLRGKVRWPNECYS